MSADITITGNTGGPAELRFTPNGKAVAEVSVADNYGRRNPQSGEWEQQGTSWFRVKVWDDAAEALAEALGTRKGVRVVATGPVRVVEFTRKDGTTGTAVEVNARTVALVPDRPRAAQAAPAADPWGHATPAPSTPNVPTTPTADGYRPPPF